MLLKEEELSDMHEVIKTENVQTSSIIEEEGVMDKNIDSKPISSLALHLIPGVSWSRFQEYSHRNGQH